MLCGKVVNKILLTYGYFVKQCDIPLLAAGQRRQRELGGLVSQLLCNMFGVASL